jgi:hypothetical protein
MAGELAGAAQGAAIGTSIMPGWGTAIGAVAGAFMGGSSVAGGGASGGGAAATPTATQAAVFGSGLDGSGWQINFGAGSTLSLDNRQDKTIRSEGPIASANPSASGARPGYSPYLDTGSDPLGMGSLGLGGVPPWIWLVFFGAVAWRVSKSKK